MDRTHQRKLERYIATAAREGVIEREQLNLFIRGGYLPQEKQRLFHAAARLCDAGDGPVAVGFGGARGPGKTHASICQVVLDDCTRYDGLKFLFLRSVGASARESFEDVLDKALPHLKQHYKPTKASIELDNGSRVLLGGFRNDRDIDKYIGIEYDGMLVEELNLISKEKADKLRGSLRSSKPGWRPRFYATFNPGGIGHAWVKKMFVEPWRRKQETVTRFVFSTVDDNAFINKEYVDYLDGLTGWLKAAWRRGDWDIAAGQYFTTWRDGVHVKPASSVVLRGVAWTWWASLDYGFIHPTAVYLLAMDDLGTVYVVDEHCERKWPVPRHAEAIKQMVVRQGLGVGDLSCIVAGGDLWKTESTGVTIEQQYQAEGITLRRANMDRAERAMRLLEYLGDVDAGIPPKIVILDRCKRLIGCIPEMQHDPNQPEKVLKTDIDDDGNGGDDPYDSIGYGLLEVDNLRQRGMKAITRQGYGRP